VNRAPQPPLPEDAKFVLRGLIILTVIAMLVALAVALVLGFGLPGRGDRDEERQGRVDDWQTYRNEQYGYQVRYPSDWSITRERNPQPGDDFEAQSIDLSNGTERVLVSVNFQGDWCIGVGVHIEKEEVTVSGITGQDYTCYQGDLAPCGPPSACTAAIQTAQANARAPGAKVVGIVRYFPGAKGKRNYWIGSEPKEDPVTVRRIVESFRFLN
jgi:hypothetical protein